MLTNLCIRRMFNTLELVLTACATGIIQIPGGEPPQLSWPGIAHVTGVMHCHTEKTLFQDLMFFFCAINYFV